MNGGPQLNSSTPPYSTPSPDSPPSSHVSMPTSPTSPYPPTSYYYSNSNYSNSKVEFVSTAQNSCGALEMNGLCGFGQPFTKPNDAPQSNGFLNGFSDQFENGLPHDGDHDNMMDGLPEMLSSLEVKDFDNNKKLSLSSSFGGGTSIWSDNASLFSPVLSNSNGSNNVSYGWGPPGSKVTSPQPWADSQTMKSATFQDMTDAMVS